MKSRILSITSLVLFITTWSFAQNTISGKVTDGETGEPLIGASVSVVETDNGTITDIDGTYTLDLSPEAKTLEFSYIGYTAKKIPINGLSTIDVVLNSGITIDPVVVVGYGTVSKSDLTGAVTKLKEEVKTARQYEGVDELLQGRVSGVTVSSNAGAPNGAISVNIRGINSLRGNNEPLYVIDGIIISSAGEDVIDASSDANELQTAQNGLTGLNPRDIESIEILKDASATAIYGSRGANGVVLITTKSGSKNKGKPSINAYATMTTSQTNKRIGMLSPLQFAKYKNEADIIGGVAPSYQIDGNNIFTIQDSVVSDTPVKTVDWQDEIYQTSISYNTGVSMAGKVNNTSYYFSGGYNNINGIVETTKLQKGDLRLNLKTDLSDRFSMDNRIGISLQKGAFAQAGSKSGGSRSFTKQILTYRPLIDKLADTGEEDLEISNPYSWLTDYDDLTAETRTNLSTSFTYKILKGLSYKIRGGLDLRQKDRERWYGNGIFKGQLDNGVAIYSNLKRTSYTLDNILTYKTKIKKDHKFNTTFALTYDGVKKQNDVFAIKDFPIQTLRSSAPQLGQTITQPRAVFLEDETIFSALARVNYNYRGKYILTTSFRADQSSKFKKGNQWGYFPSLAFAYRLGEEPFIKDLDLFYDLKLRLGWGKTGNQGIRPFQTISTYGTYNYVDVNNASIIGSAPDRIANPDLVWESTTQYNAGADISFYSGKLNFTFDAYYKITSDLLQRATLPLSTGFKTMTINRGSMENRGIELAADALLYNTDKMDVSLGGHISFNRNKIVNLGIEDAKYYVHGEEFSGSYYLGNFVSTGAYFKSPANIFMEGKPVGMFWGFETDGVYQSEDAALAGPTFNGNPNQAGDLKIVDQNGDGNIDGNDRTFIGNPNPDFTFGLNTEVRYKNFSLKAQFDGVYGNDIANGYNLEIGFAEGKNKNVLESAYTNAWSPENPENTGTRIGYEFRDKGFADVIVEDGSYLRLNILTLSYELPFKSNAFNSIDVYVSGRNLFYLTNYSGYEPQVTSFLGDGTIIGVDWVGTPNVKTFLFGINVNF